MRIRNTTGLGAAMAMLAAGITWTALPAAASTAPCHAGPLGNYCAVLTSGGNHAVDVAGTTPRYDGVIVAWDDNTGDAASDFAVLASPVGGIELAYTPLGRWTGLCASDPGSGYPGNPGYPDGLVLRSCNGSKYQAWRFAPSLGPSSATVLTNAASGLVLTDNGFDHQLTDAAARAPGTPAQQWGLDGATP